MASLLRLQPSMQARFSLKLIGRSSITLLSRRTYAQNSSNTKSGEGHSSETEQAPNHPVPSNKAQPTLKDGKQSPMADMEGNLKEDLPEDVKKHNAEVEQRYDRPYNHIADEGNIENAWKG